TWCRALLSIPAACTRTSTSFVATGGTATSATRSTSAVPYVGWTTARMVRGGVGAVVLSPSRRTLRGVSPGRRGGSRVTARRHLGHRTRDRGGGDPAGEVGGVVVDEAEQRRAAGVLPGQAEEVQAGDVGDATPVDHPAVAYHAGDVDPGVVGAVTGRPDDRAHLEVAVVDEVDDVPVRAGQPWSQAYAGRAQPAAAAPDDDVAA